MWQDVLIVLLPVVGFAQCAASIFILIIFIKMKKEIYTFLTGLAITDCLAGIGGVYAGFFGVYMTIYGETEKIFQRIKSIDCLIRGWFISIWVYSDLSQAAFLVAAALDRLIFIFVPSKYMKVASYYHGVLVVPGLLAISTSSLAPVWILAMTKQPENSSVSAFCFPAEVIDNDIEYIYQQIRIWSPVCCFALLCLTFSLFLFRQIKQSWSYAIGNDHTNNKQKFQHFICILIRSILCILSINVPLLPNANKPVTSVLYANRDVISRILYGISVCICQPIIYFAILSTFRDDVSSVFKRYSHNTKREWISAGDPPLQVGRELTGANTQFGSWYSLTGNIIGEAGLPTIESSYKERSVSFYNDAAVNTNNPGITNAYKMSAMKNANKQVTT
ncbi:unnamed protein product [Anisakis simplex]|uniref:G_PROTEIN_RECEP_F1_2 domain-containing protein n=1 Tax=Anisakis simplex TaxID=6269 RepID=A0A0M3JYQ3_ANISI|nr:unnamed protein product [Anisakis simplex]